MSYLGSLIRRYPLITFFVLAYALSWWPWVLYALDLLPQPIAGFGPFLAAIVVLLITVARLALWNYCAGWCAGESA